MAPCATPSATKAKLNRGSCCMNIIIFVSGEAPLGGGNAEEALVSPEQSSVLCLQPSFLGSSLPAVPEPRPRQLGRGGPALSPPHRLRGCEGVSSPGPLCGIPISKDPPSQIPLQTPLTLLLPCSGTFRTLFWNFGGPVLESFWGESR